VTRRVREKAIVTQSRWRWQTVPYCEPVECEMMLSDLCLHSCHAVCRLHAADAEFFADRGRPDDEVFGHFQSQVPAK